MKPFPTRTRRWRVQRVFLAGFLLPCAMVAAVAGIELARGNPSLGDCSCHTSDGYGIRANVTATIHVQPSGTFDVLIEAIGPGGIVQFHPEARDNGRFLVTPVDIVPDNSTYDLDPAGGNLTVIFSLTAPSSEETYTVNFFVRSPTGPKPSIACVEFDVQVGAGNIFLDIIEAIFDHYNVYLGTAALASLIIGTILYERNKHAVRAHGILCTISLGLTTVNIITILPGFIAMVPFWSALSVMDWMHIMHVMVGFIGYGAGFIAMVAGLGGIRDRRPGYVALACWTFCFVAGIWIWGVGV